MSSTWVSGVRAAACVDDETGEVFYLLSEETCESNVFPRRPHWSPRFFGTASSCMAAIVRWSSGCEGGGVKAGNGREFSPSGFISKWREAMSEPVRLEKRAVRAKFGSGFYEIKPALRDKVAATMVRYGHSLDDSGSLVVDMAAPKALALLEELLEVGREEGLYPWRLWSVGSVSAEPVPGLGIPRSSIRTASVTGVRAWRVKTGQGEDDFIVQYLGEKAKLVGWHHCLIQDYICRVVVREEVKCPGIAEAQIRAFRKFVESVPYASADLKIDLHLPKDTEVSSFQVREFGELCEKLGVPNTGKLSTTLGAIEEACSTWSLRYMSSEMLTFTLDEKDRATEPVGDAQPALAF